MEVDTLRALWKCELSDASLNHYNETTVWGLTCAGCALHVDKWRVSFWLFEWGRRAGWLSGGCCNRINPPKTPCWLSQKRAGAKKPQVWYQNVLALPTFPLCFCLVAPAACAICALTFSSCINAVGVWFCSFATLLEDLACTREEKDTRRAARETNHKPLQLMLRPTAVQRSECLPFTASDQSKQPGIWPRCTHTHTSSCN